MNSALASLLLKPGPDPEKREYPDLSLKGLVQSHKCYISVLPSQIPGCLMWRILLRPSSLSITLWSKKDSNFNAQSLPSHSFLASLFREQQFMRPFSSGCGSACSVEGWMRWQSQAEKYSKNPLIIQKSMYIKGTIQVQIQARQQFDSYHNSVCGQCHICFASLK